MYILPLEKSNSVSEFSVKALEAIQAVGFFLGRFDLLSTKKLSSKKLVYYGTYL